LALLRALAGTALAGSLTLSAALAVEPDEPIGNTTESETDANSEAVKATTESDGDIREATLIVQPPPQARPTEPIRPPAPTPAGASPRVVGLFGPSEATRNLLSEERRERSGRPGSGVVLGGESITRPSTDAGSLLGKAQSTSGVGVQKRTPIVTDPRSRGTRSGQLLASGSFWIPARQDLDTMLSKIDASVLSDIIAIKGPYAASYGPGFSFLDAEILRSPRFEDGPEWHGRTSLNFQTNGEQWYGRQTLFGGSDDWGVRVGYGHRTGNDYEDGDGNGIPSSYQSRDIDSTLGFDLSDDSRIEFSYLRLDQTDVEFPGQIFDIDFLVTDGYEVKYILENQCEFDRLEFETWYNRTRFEGNAQRIGKRRQIPELVAPLNFTGFTDVDAMSAGYTLAVTWGVPDCPQLTVGADLRYLKQELNENDSFQFDAGGVIIPVTGNFPIPRSHASNPGLFAEQVLPVTERLTVRGGARVDWMSANIEEIPDGYTATQVRALLGANNLDRDFALWAAYLTGEYELDCHWTATAGFGHAERPPTLTELYALQPFLAILQQGFSTVRGNAELDEERLWQIDLGLSGDYGRLRGGIHGFHAWVEDYITYKALGTLVGVPDGLGVQFVNTELATLAGGEVYGECDWNECLTPFAVLSYVEGRDHTRGSRGIPPGLPGSDEEPLPGIAPLETRLGVRLHEAVADSTERPRWGIELAARVVDNQDRVASSLLERESAGFTTWDIRSFWQVEKNLLLVAGVENFTDKHYREHLDLRTGTGVFQPGVNFYFGFEVNY
jgi:outer membrane receptor protein involved in Fe transport